MECHHFCNNPLRCPECAKRFWKWAEQHSNGRGRRRKRRDGTEPVSTAHGFYEAAAKSYREIHPGVAQW